MENSRANRPGVVAPPPLIYLGGGVAGWGLQRLLPWRLQARPGWELGLAIVLLGLGVALWAVATMESAGTPVDPNRPVTRIVTGGPYRWSRNPIYLSLSAVLLGTGIIANSGWIVIMLVPVIVVMRQGVIVREERYLARRFGEEYRRYCTRVRRWL